MTALTHPGPKSSDNHAHDGARKPLRVWRAILLIIGIVLGCAAGVGVAANLTDPVAPARVVYQRSNPNDPVPAGQATNANAREGRVPATAPALPNANAREGRVPATAPAPPNANTREDRRFGNG
jgi:hypothetical protein